MKYGRHIGAFILFLFTIFTASAQDEGKEDAVPYKELKKHIPAECRGLHKVKDIDDLLLQIYTNIDSHCIFDIPMETLERIWGIPLFDRPAYKSIYGEWGDILDNASTLYMEKNYMYEHDKDLKGKPYYSIHYTKTYGKKNSFFGGSLGRGFLPKNLPRPKVIESNFFGAYPRHPSYVDEAYLKNRDNRLVGDATYYWVNHSCDANKPLIQASDLNFIIFSGHIDIHARAKYELNFARYKDQLCNKS